MHSVTFQLGQYQSYPGYFYGINSNETISQRNKTLTLVCSLSGAPLPSFGMLAYGLVAILGLQLRRGPKYAFGIEKNNGEMILLGTTTSMVVASAYFLYILNTEFIGESCLYCLASATLSFGLFFVALKVLLLRLFVFAL